MKKLQQLPLKPGLTVSDWSTLEVDLSLLNYYFYFSLTSETTNRRRSESEIFADALTVKTNV